MLVLGRFPHLSITIPPRPTPCHLVVSGQVIVKRHSSFPFFHPSFLGEKRGKWRKMKQLCLVMNVRENQSLSPNLIVDSFINNPQSLL